MTSVPHDVSCVVHLHSLHSDGTGTVPEIARAARRGGVEVVLLTDHDTLAARRLGEERWYGPVLVLAGQEVSPRGGNHYLAFGIDEAIDHKELSPAEIVEAVRAAGGFGFAAHPFSAGSPLFERATPMPWHDLDCLDGLELWSLANDGLKEIGRKRDLVRFLLTTGRALTHPPERNLAAWDRLCRSRRVVAIGGLDAHQFGKRVGPVVPLRVMGYARSFGYLRTHALCEEPLTGEVGHDREQVFGALRSGRCYLAMDSLAPARGFGFHAEGGDGVVGMGAETRHVDGLTLRARLPRPAALRLVKDGRPVAVHHAAYLEHRPRGAGVYRLEARLRRHGRERTWILSNPIYVR